MPYISLDGNANEVLLLHRTSEESARLIIRHGFDDRLTQRKHYGRGVYLTTDAEKSYMQEMQDSARGHMQACASERDQNSHRANMSVACFRGVPLPFA